MRIWMKVIICLTMVISIAEVANAYTWTPDMIEAYEDISSLKLEKGRMILKKNSLSSNSIAPYLASYADMIEIGITENKNIYEHFMSAERERIAEIETLEVNTAFQGFLTAEIYLHQGFVKLKFGHEIQGASDILKAYRILNKNVKKYPLFISQYKSFGILQVVLGSIPKKFQWIAKILGFQADVAEGITSLNKVIKQDRVFSNEAQLFKFILNTYIISTQKDESNQLIEFIHKNASNKAIQFVGTSLLIRMGKSERALEVIKSASSSEEYLSVPFLNYYLGEIYLQKAMYKEAIAAYSLFLTKQLGFNFIKDTYYKLFLCYALSNDNPAATKTLAKINGTGETIVEVDKTAQKYYQNHHKQKIYFSVHEEILKKVQLATEGGYYENGIKLLNQIGDIKSIDHPSQIEYIYRLARIEDLTNDTVKAITLYLKVISLSDFANYKLPFAPRSYLYLGNIYVHKNEYKVAKEFYTKALSFEDYEGSNSVEIKVKAALNKCK